MDKNRFLVIMAGGAGTRFWPCSRSNRPKQFLDFFGTGRTLLQQTFDRFAKIIPTENIFIASNKQYKDLILEQLPMRTENQLLLEPARRNTAPCIAYASFKIKSLCENANVVVTPADHLMTNTVEFSRIIDKGLNYASTHDSILTIGIKPSRPEAGYGYIK
jgi:mannose-1-phosphate guanylyltransferase